MRGACLWLKSALVLLSPPTAAPERVEAPQTQPMSGPDSPATAASPPSALQQAAQAGPSGETASEATRKSTRIPARATRVRRYLALPRVASDLVLPNGALGLGSAGGWPDLYRLSFGIGLLDHLSLGVDTHWLPEQSAPRLAPRVAVAAYRGEHFELGLEYHQRLYSPPSLLAQGEAFEQRDHLAGLFATFGLGWVSASGTLGAMAFRERDPAANTPATNYVERVRIAGGLRLRVGDERWGVVLRGELPVASLSLGFELRIGLFGQRPLLGRRVR